MVGYPLVMASAPNFLGKDYTGSTGQVGNTKVCVEIDPVRKICFISQLAAVEGVLLVWVEQIDIVRFANLTKAIIHNLVADVVFFILG